MFRLPPITSIIVAILLTSQACCLNHAWCDSSPTLAVGGDSISVAESGEPCECDRIWLVSSRGLTHCACAANVENPNLSVYRIHDGGCLPSDVESFSCNRDPSRPLVVYVHGNRMSSCDLLERALPIYKSIRRCRVSQCIDWVIWSWPSDKEGLPIEDARKKAQRTDAQSLYLSWFLHPHVSVATPVTMIGYSFGSRVISGSLHSLSGRSLAGRELNLPPVSGAQINVGMIAPAMDSASLSHNGRFYMATDNMGDLTLLYNHKDAVLKRFWRLARVRQQTALGYSGPKSFASRQDGSAVCVRSKDCSNLIGRSHGELDYYSGARAGAALAQLINQMSVPEFSNAKNTQHRIPR